MKSVLAAHWYRLQARYTALKVRERQLLAACLVILPAYLLNSTIYEPAKLQQNRASIAAETAQRNLETLSRDLAVLQTQLQQSPDTPLNADKAKLQHLEQQADSILSSMGRALVSPQEMNEVLKTVLGHSAGLRLIQLKTLPPESVLSPNSDATNSQTFDLYRHGVEISIEGRYADLQNYLLQLEAQEKQILWDHLHFRVDQYPLSILTLRVHTLSIDKAWLSL